MAAVWVGIGSNIGREVNVASGLAALEREFGALRVSPIYRAAAVGMAGDEFYNLVAGFRTELAPADLVGVLHRIEAEHGRRRDPAAGRCLSRTLDIDLLLYDDLVRHDEAVDVPRADILRYAFVLRPLADVAGAERHPETGATFAELWAAFDRSGDDLEPVGPGHGVPA